MTELYDDSNSTFFGRSIGVTGEYNYGIGYHAGLGWRTIQIRQVACAYCRTWRDESITRCESCGATETANSFQK